jgi:hypothetical protein
MTPATPPAPTAATTAASPMPAEDFDDGRVVEAAEPGTPAGQVEPLGGGREWRRAGVGAGGVGDQSHVLDDDVQRALHLVVGARDHAGVAVVEHERSGGSIADHPQVERASRLMAPANVSARLEAQLVEMRAADAARDVDAFVAADLAFHQTVLHAAGNGLIAALLDPLSRLLVPARRQTSEFEDIRRHALEYHAAILEAVRAADAEQARRAMHDHIGQAREDLRVYVLKTESSEHAA